MSRIAEDYYAKHGRYPDAPGAKVEGTSRDAARAMAPSAGGLRGQVLAVIAAKPSTADEVAAALDLSILTIRPRVSELVALGEVEDGGERRCNASRRRAVVWKRKVPDALR